TPALFSGLHHPRITVTPDGKDFLFGSHNLWDGTPDEVDPWLTVFDSATMQPVARFTPLKDWELRRRPAITDDGKRVAFVDESGYISIATVESNEFVVIAHGETATALAFNTDGSRLIGGFDDGRIVVWETDTGDTIGTIHAHGDGQPPEGQPREPETQGTDIGSYSTSRVEQVIFRPGSTQFASAGLDGRLVIWDSSTGEDLVSRSFEYAIPSFSYSPDGSQLVVADQVGKPLVLDADTLEVLQELAPVSGPVAQFAYSPDADLIAGAGPGEQAHIWSTESGNIVRKVHGSYLDTHSVAFVDGGTRLLVNAGEGILRGYLMDP